MDRILDALFSVRTIQQFCALYRKNGEPFAWNPPGIRREGTAGGVMEESAAPMTPGRTSRRGASAGPTDCMRGVRRAPAAQPVGGPEWVWLGTYLPLHLHGLPLPQPSPDGLMMVLCSRCCGGMQAEMPEPACFRLAWRPSLAVLVAWRNRRATALRIFAPFLFLLLALLIDRALQANSRNDTSYQVRKRGWP
jgi:hypothetical protein